MTRLSYVVSKKDLRATIGSVAIAIVGAVFLLVLDVLMPFTSAYADVIPAYLIYTSFFCVFVLIYSLFSLCFMAVPIPGGGQRRLPVGLLQTMNFSLFLSVLAIFSLFVDRAFYRGVDFASNNFVEMRAALNSGATGSISSVFSFFGNLFQFSYFFTLLAVVFYRELISARRFLVYVFFICACVCVGSYLLGGRAIIAVVLLSVLAGFVARVVVGVSSFGVFFKGKSLLLFFFMSFMFLFVVIYVFYMRSSVGGTSSIEYLNNFLFHLHGVSLLPIGQCGADFFCDIKNYFYLSLLYFTHIFWVLAENVDSPFMSSGGDPLFGAVLSIFSRWLQFDPGNYEFAGLFNSMPGSLYYKWGAWGVAVGAGFVGFLLALAMFCLRFYKGMLSLVFFYLLYMLLLVSPVLSIFNVISFVFVVFCLFFYFFVFHFLGLVLRRVRL